MKAHPQLICPMRKSGGPCVKDECAWWHDYDDCCAVLSVAVTLADIFQLINQQPLPSTITVNKDYRPPVLPNANGYDDDIPF